MCVNICDVMFSYQIMWTLDIFSLMYTAWKHPKYPCFCAYCRQEFGVNIDIHESSVRFYVQTTIDFQRKCLGTPDCKYMENMSIDFIWLNVQVKSLIQTILYQFKWDTTLWKSPKCPQYMQRTWWQTVATQHTGLRVIQQSNCAIEFELQAKICLWNEPRPLKDAMVMWKYFPWDSHIMWPYIISAYGVAQGDGLWPCSYHKCAIPPM